MLPGRFITVYPFAPDPRRRSPVLAHLSKPLTRKPSRELLGSDLGPAPAGAGGGEGGQPHRLALLLGANTVFAMALLLSAVLVGLATVALH